MTTSHKPAYKAPDGFYKSYTFDKAGNVFADGKQLSGVQLDVNGLKDPNAPVKGTGWNAIPALLHDKAHGDDPNPYSIGGGSISRLSVDENGNLFAEIGAPSTPKPTGVGTNGVGTKGPGKQAPQPTANMQFGNSAPLAQKAQKVQLSGIALDPARTSRNSGGALGDNDAYLREDRDGLYFAQVNKGSDVVAYGYSNYQTPSAPVAGPAQPSATRRQGGNAGGGVGPGAPDGITLLGS